MKLNPLQEASQDLAKCITSAKSHASDSKNPVLGKEAKSRSGSRCERSASDVKREKEEDDDEEEQDDQSAMEEGDDCADGSGEDHKMEGSSDQDDDVFRGPFKRTPPDGAKHVDDPGHALLKMLPAKLKKKMNDLQSNLLDTIPKDLSQLLPCIPI